MNELIDHFLSRLLYFIKFGWISFPEQIFMVKRDISMFMTEVIYETKSLHEKLKTLIETPEKNLTAEEKKIKKRLIYFLYLIKTEKG